MGVESRLLIIPGVKRGSHKEESVPKSKRESKLSANRRVTLFGQKYRFLVEVPMGVLNMWCPLDCPDLRLQVILYFYGRELRTEKTVGKTSEVVSKLVLPRTGMSFVSNYVRFFETHTN